MTTSVFAGFFLRDASLFFIFFGVAELGARLLPSRYPTPQGTFCYLTGYAGDCAPTCAYDGHT